MKKMVFFLAFFSQIAFAADMYYPELMVSPKATERIEIEGKKEQSNGPIFNLPLQISSVLTLTSGLFLMQGDSDTSKDPDKYAPKVGIAVGAGWLIINSYLGYMHRPYRTAKNAIFSLPAKSPGEALTRERLAEEAINGAGELANKLNWLSTITNFGTSIYLASSAKSKTTGQTVAILSVAASFLPLLFDHPWYKVAKDQRDYKRKIYGPLTITPTFLPSPDKKLAQGIVLSYTF